MSMQIRLTSDGLTNLLIGTITAVQCQRIWKMMMQQFELQRRLPLSLPTATFKINQHEEGVRPGQRGDLEKQKGRKGYKHTHTYIRVLHRFAVPEHVCWGLTCSAWPSPVNLKHWPVSSGLVLGDDSPSPLLTAEWRSYRYTEITVNINKQRWSETDVHLR